jgi:hypothetical protein
MNRTKWITILGVALLAALLPVTSSAQSNKPAPQKPARIQQEAKRPDRDAPDHQKRRRAQNAKDRRDHRTPRTPAR